MRSFFSKEFSGVTDHLKLRLGLKYLLPAPVELRDTGLYFAMVRTPSQPNYLLC
jgi:hypothetical protein